MKTLWNSLALSLLACTLPACEDAPAPAPVAVAPAAQPAPAAPAVVPAVATAELQVQPAYGYTYSPAGRRDPFLAFEVQVELPPTSDCKSSLCQWELEQLKVVAIITGDSSPMAMVEDPQGRGFILRRDTQVGRLGGRVTQIRRDSVTVTQYVPGPKGNIAVPVELRIEQGARAAAPHDLLSDRPYEL